MKHFLLAAALVLIPVQAAAQDAASERDVIVTAKVERPIDGPRLPDTVLATLRGGISLPNGLQVAIGIDIQTRIDNVLVLQTVYASDGPTAGVRVYTSGADTDRIPPGTVTVRESGSIGTPSIVVTRSAAGTTVVPGNVAAPSTVNLVAVEPGGWLNANGQMPIPLVANGEPVTQGPGTFSLTSDNMGSVVMLDSQMVQIRHLVGQATGIAVANTGNDRLIETVSSVNIDLQGGTALATLAGLFMADRVAFDTMARR